ncbi:betaine-aldehyde dehydrogenase [Croceicoccus estronivorus]|nr:betaine-aldehyde dehydrogenase [Croceicoccus estronivorus]
MTKPSRPAFLDGTVKQLLIDGEHVPAASGETFLTHDPSTGEVLAEVAMAGTEDVDRAVAAARAAFEGEWSHFTPAERQAALLKLADLIDAEWDELARIDTMEMGRPITSSLAIRSMVVRLLRYFAGAATAVTGQSFADSFPIPMQAYSVREPVGVVGVIVPWNGPIFTAAWKCAPALAVGCTVVLKPSELGTITPLRFAELCLEAGIPKGVVNVVSGFGDVGAAIAAHPGVDKITFTGSCATGQSIIRASAATTKKVTMELGGKSPNIVFADANMDRAVQFSAMGVFNNSGQVCSAGTRLFVERPIYEEFVERVAEFGRNMKIGPSCDPGTQIGPLVSERQMNRVLDYIRIGQEEGARLVSGGTRLTDGELGNGWFVPPTVFADVTNDMRIAREEIFGPVVCAIPFDDFDEVMRLANDSTFGLAAGVWTQDITRANRAAKRLRVGSVWINHYQAMDPAVPFGGYKQSGFGREGSFEMIDGYLQTKGIWTRID